MLRSWLQLLRAPNLFTVPGDPLAGFLLAAGAAHGGQAFLDGRAALAVVASLCLYAAGLVMNDLCDLVEDRRERPKRPLASGAIPVRSAWLACGVLSIAGVLAMTAVAGQAGLIAALALTACVAFYNGIAKHVPVFGALVMGACRGLSVLLGSVACLGRITPLAPEMFVGAVIITLHIAAVTNLARHETRAEAPTLAKVLPALPLLLALLLANHFTGPLMRSYTTTILAIALVLIAAELGRLFRKDAPPIPPIIGALIRVLLLVQAALCLVFPTTVSAQLTGGLLIVLAPISRAVGRRFYAS